MVADLCSAKCLMNLKWNSPQSSHWVSYMTGLLSGLSPSEWVFRVCFKPFSLIFFPFFFQHNFHQLLYRKPFCSPRNGAGGVVPEWLRHDGFACTWVRCERAAPRARADQDPLCSSEGDIKSSWPSLKTQPLLLNCMQKQALLTSCGY